MSFLENKINFEKNNECPLCRSKDFSLNISKYKNVYSELISQYINCEENDLFKFNKVCRCNTCSLVFWRFKLSKEIRRYLYNKLIPIHPKGEDSSGKNFNLKSLIVRIEKLDKFSGEKKRILKGYLTSMDFKNQDEIEKVTDMFFKKEDFLNSDIEFLKKIFNRGPKYLSRYSGFRDTKINQLIMEIFNKYNDTKHYFEYGCTIWGAISFVENNGHECISIVPKNEIFWDCRSHQIETNQLIIDEINIGKYSHLLKNSLLSLFLILDHIDDPYYFLRNLIDKGLKFVFIVLEKSSEQNLPLQHLTGWNETSLIYLSKKLGGRIKMIDLESNSYNAALLSFI